MQRDWKEQMMQSVSHDQWKQLSLNHLGGEWLNISHGASPTVPGHTPTVAPYGSWLTVGPIASPLLTRREVATIFQAIIDHLHDFSERPGCYFLGQSHPDRSFLSIQKNNHENIIEMFAITRHHAHSEFIALLITVIDLYSINPL